MSFMRHSLSLFLISAAVLGLEIILMRLMMIAEYHHFSYFVISTALLGFGVSGTVLSLWRGWVVAHSTVVLWASAWGFAISAPSSYLFCQFLPIRTLEVLWSPSQWLWVLATQLILFVPFLFGAVFIGLFLITKAREANKWYAVNLVGSGVGACLFVVLQYGSPIQSLLAIASLMAALSAFLSSPAATNRIRFLNGAGAALVVLLAVLAQKAEIRMNEYKTLPSLLRLAGSERILQRHSPLGRIDVVSGNAIHEVVDLSPIYGGPLPPQMMLTSDGGRATTISRIETMTQAEYLDWSIPAAAYHVREPTQVLVIGSGGGSDLHLAAYHNVPRITALDLNRQVIDLVRGDLATAAGNVYQKDEVETVVTEARAWLQSSREEYDLIVIPLLDSFSTASSGVYALNESYLYTVEAFERILERLSPDGCLSIVRWIQFPPRDSIKLFATAVEALRNQGVDDPKNHLAMVRFQFAANLIVSKDPFSSAELEGLKRFCTTRNFQTVWYPGMSQEAAGYFHELGTLTQAGGMEGRAAIHDAARKLFYSDSNRFFEESLFDVHPATDDRPYFFNFFRWRLLPIAYRMGPNAAAQIEYGYVVLVFSFVQATLVAALLILLPLRRLRRESGQTRHRLRILIYFSAIGLAFLFLEMAFIQKVTLYLGHPVLATAVVLASFLIFSGVGSFFGNRLGRQPANRIAVSVALIVLFGIGYAGFILPGLGALGALPLAGRSIVSVLLLAPMAMAMGVPFSQGLISCERVAPSLVPWAWGINGFASVVAASLAVLLSMSFGFRNLVWLSLVLYIVAVGSPPDGQRK